MSQDIAENPPDIAHFSLIHCPSIFRGKNFSWAHNFLVDCIHHSWDLSWRVCDPPGDHRAVGCIKHVTTIAGYKILEMDFEDFEQLGVAILNLRFTMRIGNWKIQGTFVQGNIPLEPFKQKIVYLLFLENKLFSKLAAIFLSHAVAFMVSQHEYSIAITLSPTVQFS